MALQGAGGGHAVMFSHGKASSELPELKVPGELGKQITSVNDSIGPFGFPWCLLPPPPPPQSPVSARALEEGFGAHLCYCAKGTQKRLNLSKLLSL